MSSLRGRNSRSLPYVFNATNGVRAAAIVCRYAPAHQWQQRRMERTKYLRIAICRGDVRERWDGESSKECDRPAARVDAPGRSCSADEQQPDHLEDFSQREPT